VLKIIRAKEARYIAMVAESKPK